jgi:hypothetical protein
MGAFVESGEKGAADTNGAAPAGGE